MVKGYLILWYIFKYVHYKSQISDVRVMQSRVMK